MIAIATEGSDLGLYAKTLRNDKQNNFAQRQTKSLRLRKQKSRKANALRL